MNFKKVFTAALSCITICGMLPLTQLTLPNELIATAAENEEYSEGTYELLSYRAYSDHVEIIGCDTSAQGELVIPDNIDNLPVTSIGKYAFYDCSNLTGITIPESVTSIDVFAFKDCTKLVYADIPNSVTSIGSGAFHNCTKLTSVQLPENIDAINSYTFYNCRSLESITIPSNVKSIGEYAFTFCLALTSLTIPKNVLYIYEYAFSYCSYLESLEIEDGLRRINRGAFSYCQQLTTVFLPVSVEYIGKEAFAYCTNLAEITITNPYVSFFMDHTTISNGKKKGSIYFDGTVYACSKNVKEYVLGTYVEIAWPFQRYGDVDFDGFITVTDAVKVMSYIINPEKYPLSDEAIKFADVNYKGDGLSNMDALAIQEYVAQGLGSLPQSYLSYGSSIEPVGAE